VSGCGASSGSGSQTPHISPPNANVLQLAVGTANLYGTGVGLNVVTTYRQPKGGQKAGDSGSLVSSPTFTVPVGSGFPATAAMAGLPGGPEGLSTIETGPAPSEISTTGAGTMTATAQAPPAPTNTTVTTFGQSGGVFGLGIEPFNYESATGFASTTTPYPVPVYDFANTTTTPDANQLPAAWGGVPAFDILGTGFASNFSNIVPGPGPGDAVPLPQTLGISEGIDVFDGLTPVASTNYTLTVTLAGTSSGTFTKTANAQMASTALLPTMAAPTYTPDTAGDGGGTFAITLPAGVTEAYIQVVDYGNGATNCNGAGAADGFTGAPDPVYYTIEATASGTYTQAALNGPDTGGGATPSICTEALNTAANAGTDTPADVVGIWAIGFDYPAYESSYPNSAGNPQPAITGASGQSDITISPQGLFPTGSTVPAAYRRHSMRTNRPQQHRR
jgi:hypothetical protein